MKTRRDFFATSIYPALTTALTAVPESYLMYLTMQLTGNGMLRTASPRCAVRQSMRSESSSANLATRKPCIEV